MRPTVGHARGHLRAVGARRAGETQRAFQRRPLRLPCASEASGRRRQRAARAGRRRRTLVVGCEPAHQLRRVASARANQHVVHQLVRGCGRRRGRRDRWGHCREARSVVVRGGISSQEQCAKSASDGVNHQEGTARRGTKRAAWGVAPRLPEHAREPPALFLFQPPAATQHVAPPDVRRVCSAMPLVPKARGERKRRRLVGRAPARTGSRAALHTPSRAGVDSARRRTWRSPRSVGSAAFKKAPRGLLAKQCVSANATLAPFQAAHLHALSNRHWAGNVEWHLHRRC